MDSYKLMKKDVWKLGSNAVGALSEAPWRMCGVMINLLRGNAPFARVVEDNNYYSLLGDRSSSTVVVNGEKWNDVEREDTISKVGKKSRRAASAARRNFERRMNKKARLMEILRGGD